MLRLVIALPRRLLIRWMRGTLDQRIDRSPEDAGQASPGLGNTRIPRELSIISGMALPQGNHLARWRLLSRVLPSRFDVREADHVSPKRQLILPRACTLRINRQRLLLLVEDEDFLQRRSRPH